MSIAGLMMPGSPELAAEAGAAHMAQTSIRTARECTAISIFCRSRTNARALHAVDGDRNGSARGYNRHRQVISQSTGTIMVQAIPAGYAGVTAYLVVRGAARALDYYKKAFGAKELMRFPAPNDTIAHAEI